MTLQPDASDAGGLPFADALAVAERHCVAGRLVEAEAWCRRVLEAQPNEPNAIHLLGMIAHQSGRLADAVEQLRRATALAPDVARFHANLGEMCRLAGLTAEAVAAGRRAIALNPDYPEALCNLGVALQECKNYEEAAECQHRAIALAPGFALAHNNYGNALRALKRFDEAIEACCRAILAAPEFADAWCNLGISLHHAGRFEEAVAALRRAVALAPKLANARAALGILLLTRGDLAEGWEEYEWRLQSTTVKGPPFPQRPWRGESLLDRHIYVQAEQGFGDTLQFSRYLPRLKARAGAVSVQVHQSLLVLMRESLPGIAFDGDRSPPQSADCECTPISLARIFRTRLETIPATVPYLRPPEAIAMLWRQRLATMSGLKTGVVWAGRPTHANDFRRSLDLAALAPLAAVPGATFASLQVGEAAVAALAAHPRLEIADLSPQLGDFAETAGAVAALDLVITVDTAVAHLAGALGKPVWVLLPSVADWRWLTGREDSPWYPTMRLFRQGRGEGWPEVIGRVAAEFAAVAAGERTRLMPFKQAGDRRAAMAAAINAIDDARAQSGPPSQQPGA